MCLESLERFQVTTYKYVASITCPWCADRIWSRYTHDCRPCFCGYCFIDGGRSYARVGWGGLEFPEPWTPPPMSRMRVSLEELASYEKVSSKWPY